MQAFQAYLKHPSDKNTPKVFRIKSIKELSMAIDMMASIVGQDAIKKVEMIDGGKRELEGDSKDVKGDLTEETAKGLLTALNKAKGDEKAKE